MLLYRVCRAAAMDAALSSAALAQELGGGPLSEAPWYNVSLTPSADGQSASCTIPVSGARAGCDVVVRALRAEGGGGPRLLYNALGSARWEIVTLDALLPARGGLPRRLSLLPGDGVPKSGDRPGPPSGGPPLSIGEASAPPAGWNTPGRQSALLDHART